MAIRMVMDAQVFKLEDGKIYLYLETWREGETQRDEVVRLPNLTGRQLLGDLSAALNYG